MSLPRWSVDNHILANLLFLLAAAAGAFVFADTVVDVYPDVSFDQGQILVAWPGASPEEVETAITRKIEDEIQDVGGVDRIVSTSERDRALIDVKFLEEQSDAEFQRHFEDLRAKVAQVRDLPEDSETPTVRRISVNELFPLLQVVVVDRGGTDYASLRAVARALRRHLMRIDGVLRVSDFGIPEREWKVEVRRAAMEGHGLDLLTVAQRIAARHVDLPAGTLVHGGAELSVDAAGEFASVDDLLDFVLASPPGASPVRLRDVADVVEGFEKTNYRNRYNGLPGVALSVAKRGDADAIDVRGRVAAALEDFRAGQELPAGVELAVTTDTTRIIKDRLEILGDNLGLGVVLVLAVLWVFLGLRNALLALIGIPFSFLMAILVLGPLGITINALSLFSLVLISGMVVDDAVVVLENVYRHLEEGRPLRDAIIDGTREVFWPVVCSTLTTLAAFLPMLLMEGVIGEFMSIIPKVVIAVLSASLAQCMVVLPAHYAHFGSRGPRPRGIERSFGRAFERFTRRYLRVLEPTLRRPGLVIGTVLVLAALAAGVSGSLPVELFPSDFQAFYANIVLDASYGIEETAAAVAAFEAELAPLLGTRLESFTTALGSTFTEDNQLLLKPNVAQILLYVPEGRGVEPIEVVREVQERAARTVAGRTHRFERIVVDLFKDGPPVGKPVAVRVACPDFDVAKAVSRRIQDHLRSLPGVHSVTDNLDLGPEELRFVPDPVRSERAGVAFRDAALLLRTANEGFEAGELVPPRSDDEVTIRVMLRPEDRGRPEDLALLRLPGPAGAGPALGDVCRLESSRGPASVYHYDGDRVVLVTADVDTERTDSETVNRSLIRRFGGIAREMPEVRLAFGGEYEETNRSFASLRKAFVVAVLLIYTILAAQFRSYVLPLVVMVVVPFSFIGVVLGLWILGFPVTIMAFIAVVGLAGVVVNDSLVLVDFIRRRHEETGDARRAVLESCRTRMRPVVITTVTTVFGLLPMALGITGYSKVWSPFAAVITFGLSLAMVLTLFLVPAVYLVLARRFPRLVGAAPGRPPLGWSPPDAPASMPARDVAGDPARDEVPAAPRRTSPS